MRFAGKKNIFFFNNKNTNKQKTTQSTNNIILSCLVTIKKIYTCNAEFIKSLMLFYHGLGLIFFKYIYKYKLYLHFSKYIVLLIANFKKLYTYFCLFSY